MFFPEGQVRIFVYGEPVNMRLSYDGLYAKIRNVMGRGVKKRYFRAESSAWMKPQ
jgi:hypothetical protein